MAPVRYRGREGYWAWVLHRLSGLAILAFLLIHIVDTALMLRGPDAYDHAIALYRCPWFRVGEVLIFAGVLYHALNGLRLLAVDLSEQAFIHQRGLWYAVLGLSGAAMLPIAFTMLRPVLGPG